MQPFIRQAAGCLALPRLRFWYQASLVNRATVWSLALACAGMLLVASLVYLLVAEQMRKSVDDRLQALAALNAQRIESELERIFIAVDNLSHRSLVANGLLERSASKGQLQTFLYEFRHGFPEVGAMSLVDPAGQIVVSAASRPLLDAATLSAAQRARQPAFALHASLSASRLYFAYPVAHASTGQLLGVVAGDLDLPALLARLRLGAAMADGLPLSLAVDDVGGRNIYRSAPRIEGDVLRIGQPLAGRLASNGVPQRLQVEVARAAAYAPLHVLAANILSVGVFVLFLIVVVIRKLATNILRPLRDMSQHAMEIAGAGPSGLRDLAVKRSDEIGAMGTAFNEMVYSLREAHESQEDEVRRRTGELADTQRRLAGVLAGIDDVVYAATPGMFRPEYISPAALPLFGLTSEQCLAQPSLLGDLVQAEDLPRLLKARSELQPGVPGELRYRIRRRDGSLRWLQDRFRLDGDAATGRQRVSGVIRDVTAVVEAEASLHLRERALASISCGVVITDMLQPGHPILYVNDTFQQITGYRADEVIGRNCAFLQGESREPQLGLDEIRSALAEGRECKAVVRNYRKNGEAFWNELQLVPLRDALGQVTHYIGVQNDISPSIAATQALVDSEQRLALTIEALHEGVWDWHIADNRLITSPSWSGILGVEPGQLVVADGFANFIRYSPAQWARHVEREIDAHLAGSASEFYLEHQMCLADGRLIWVANHGRVVERDAHGQPLRMVGTIVDITQRVESSQQVVSLMGQLSTIFTLSPDAFIYFNEARRVSYVNPAFERLTGIQAGELSGLLHEDVRGLLLERADPAQVFPWFDSGRQDGDQDGQLMYLLRPTRRVLLVSTRGGDGSAAVIYLRDVTRETEVDRMKSEFLTTAAHELRTPMASIMGFAELLMLREFSPARTRDMLSTVHRQARRLTDLINELLDLARIESRAGKDFRIVRQRIDPVIRDAIATVHVDGDRSRMHLNLPDSLPELDIDPAKMQQAIINVLSNAYKYSPQGGPIDITARQRSQGGTGQLAIVISDRGMGMTHDQVARVFERFYRADPSGHIPGTGLGMSLVKEIMESHGGSVELDSEIGAGTSVSLWLPVRDGASAAPALLH